MKTRNMKRGRGWRLLRDSCFRCRFAPGTVFVARRPQRTPRVGRQELCKSSLRQRPADVRHEPLVEPGIMHRNQDGTKHLRRKKVMPYRPPGEVQARVTVAARFDRGRVALVFAVPKADGPAGGKRVRVAAVAR